MTDLLPCPFCAGEAKTIQPMSSAPYVLCTRCHCGGPVSSTASMDEAISSWNRREINHQTSIEPTLKGACERIGAKVDPFMTGSKNVTVRVADARRVLEAARAQLNDQV